MVLALHRRLWQVRVVSDVPAERVLLAHSGRENSRERASSRRAAQRAVVADVESTLVSLSKECSTSFLRATREFTTHLPNSARFALNLRPNGQKRGTSLLPCRRTATSSSAIRDCVVACSHGRCRTPAALFVESGACNRHGPWLGNGRISTRSRSSAALSLKADALRIGGARLFSSMGY